MIKLAGIIIAALITSVLLKKRESEFALLAVICAVVLIFITISEDLYDVISRLGELASGVGGIEPYIKLMLKVTGVSLAAQLLADLCRDCGESALASQTETASKIIILVIALPLFEAVIEIVTGLLK